MKKLFTILIVLFIAMGSSLVFAQTESSSLENENIEEMEDFESKETSPRFPDGKKPKIAQKVGEGSVVETDGEMESSEKITFVGNLKFSRISLLKNADEADN